jgi:hypothetical protein
MTGRAHSEMIGRKFHRLTVIAESHVEGRRGKFWLCKCDCGSMVTAYGGHLRAGSTKGCGCAKAGVNRTHGMSRTPEHRAWESARARCSNPHNQRFAHYGARGIKMHPAWEASFEAFFAGVGPRPSGAHSLDRIDNNLGYEPGNCRWATAEEQNNNRSFNRLLILGGRQLTVAQAAREAGVPHATILSRLDRGLSDEEAVHGS